MRAASGALVLDDTYNANPDSMRAAIDVLAAASGTRWLVLGDMGEVGARRSRVPSRNRRLCARAGRDPPVCDRAISPRDAVAAFGAGATHVDDVPLLASLLQREAHAGVTVLVKGSRFMRMERVVAALTGQAAGRRALMLLLLSEWLEQ